MTHDLFKSSSFLTNIGPDKGRNGGVKIDVYHFLKLPESSGRLWKNKL